MVFDISEKIKSLPQEKQNAFWDELIQNLYDENWCEREKIDYTDPDMLRAKEILFYNKYSKYLTVSDWGRLTN